MVNSEPELVYIIFCDIVKYSIASSDKMNEVIDKFFSVVKQSVNDNLNNCDSNYLNSAGDGCLIIAQDGKDNNTHISKNGIDNVLKCAIQIFIGLKNYSIPIRMAISTGSLKRTADINGRPQFIGHDINDCQRIMDFGEESHLLMSRNMFDNLNRDNRDTVTMVIGSYNIHIEKPEKQYWDKHGNMQELYIVFINVEGDQSSITKRRPPPLKWKGSKGEALTRANRDFFKDILNKSDKFWSITLESPSEWLLDESLLYVLFKQAAINGNGDPSDNKFKRFIICDKDQINTPDGAMLRNLHKFANVQFCEITQEAAAKGISENQELLTVKNELNLAKKSDKDFVNKPLREMWISYKDEKPLSAGYGNGDPGDHYKLIDAEDGVESFIHHIFSALDNIKHCKKETTK
jgi:hypothetical protein